MVVAVVWCRSSSGMERRVAAHVVNLLDTAAKRQPLPDTSTSSSSSSTTTTTSYTGTTTASSSGSTSPNTLSKCVGDASGKGGGCDAHACEPPQLAGRAGSAHVLAANLFIVGITSSLAKVEAGVLRAGRLHVRVHLPIPSYSRLYSV